MVFWLEEAVPQELSSDGGCRLAVMRPRVQMHEEIRNCAEKRKNKNMQSSWHCVVPEPKQYLMLVTCRPSSGAMLLLLRFRTSAFHSKS